MNMRTSHYSQNSMPGLKKKNQQFKGTMGRVNMTAELSFQLIVDTNQQCEGKASRTKMDSARPCPDLCVQYPVSPGLDKDAEGLQTPA